MASKERLDIFLAEQNYFSSRSKAKRAIMAGLILVDGELVDKAGTKIKTTANIKIKGDRNPYVSRGGFKLEKALQVFEVDPTDLEAIDIGASTGGFTDCLLQHGAKKVYAIDVGYGQLAWKLRQDNRVVVKERTNFRYLSPTELPISVELIVTDVSFISLRLILPQALKFMQDNSDFIGLIKPQFEAGKARVGKNGVVRDPAIHEQVLCELSEFFSDLGLGLIDLNFSPITGANSNNIEFLVHLKKNNSLKNNLAKWQQIIKNTVKTAHQQHGG